MRLLTAAAAVALAAGLACDTAGTGPAVTIELTSPQGPVLEFSGRFGKHDRWEEVEGTTPATFEFDLSNWPACYCLHRLVVCRTTPGSDPLRIRTFCRGDVVSDTFVTTGDTLDYAPCDGV